SIFSRYLKLFFNDFSLMKISPESGNTMPRIAFISVVFPEPLGPRIEKIPPSFMERSMPFSTSFFPNLLYKSLISIMIYLFHSWIFIHQIVWGEYWGNFFRKIYNVYKQTSH